jgi:hypothetical protein
VTEEMSLSVAGVGRRAGAEPPRSAALDRRPIGWSAQSHPFLPSERLLARLVGSGYLRRQAPPSRASSNRRNLVLRTRRKTRAIPSFWNIEQELVL